MNLGVAWRSLPTGDRGENLRRAITMYEAALEVYTYDAHPPEWATTQDNRATALTRLADLPGEDRCGRLRQAIACRKAALLVHTPRAFPREHAATMLRLRLDRAAYEAAGWGEAVAFDDIPPAE